MATTSLCYSSTTPKTPNKNNPISVSKVRVIVRVRPFLPHETTRNGDDPVSCISLLDQDFQSQNDVAVYLKDPFTSRNECYKLDSFFDQEDNNVGQIFDREVRSMIPAIFGGCNATVFAYGATGSGKTYTMQGTEEQPGLMPLAMSTILSICQNTGSAAEISYYEVYMDRCYDLLELKASEISVLDDKDGQIHLRGLSQVPVNTMSEFQEVFSSGVQRRKTAHTGLNDVSSRSHGVLVISVLSIPPDGSGSLVCGKLNLIDLAGYRPLNWGNGFDVLQATEGHNAFKVDAGNEDNRRSCNEGIRLQESAKINQSLFALSNVIYALNNNKPRTPYRDSKLTRILQDSLGGSSRALMVACLNPGEYQESVHTVSLAARSRHISNFVSSTPKLETPKTKVDMEAKLRAWQESKGKKKSSQQRLGAFNSPLLKKTPGSIMTSAKRSVNFNNSVKGGRTSTNQEAQHTTERAFDVSFRNLLDGEFAFDSCKENVHSGVKDNDKRETEHEDNKAAWESYNSVPVEPLNKGLNSQVTNEIKDAVLQSPLRKALSPININGIQNHLEALSLTRTPFSATCSTKKGLQENGTPLDKFSARSSALKNCLVQEYMDLLNNASREELLELKGIGEKMADYIIDLREESPLKSLSDLEKIGLSLKQAHNLFTKAAKKLFDDKAEDSMLN